MLDGILGGLFLARQKQPRQPIGAPRRIFMHVRMPGRSQRQVKMVGQRCSQQTIFARAGNVQNVGTENPERTGNGSQVAEESGIEGKVFIQRKREKAALELKRRQIALGKQMRDTVSGTDAEKRQIAAAREGFKLAAGVGDAIDFVEGVGKISDPRSLPSHSGKI
jgi:hypothetical protein